MACATEGLDIVSFAFGSHGQRDVEKAIYIDASDESNYISPRQALTLVKQLVAGLQKQGVKKGDCICLHAGNNVLYAPLWLGAIGAGGIVSGTNPASTVPELVHHFAITKPKYIIAQEGNFERIAEAARQCGIPADRIFILGLADELNQDPAPYRSWRTLLSHGEQEWNKIDDKDEQASTIALLGSTSGTTGLPKAAKISHRYLVAQCTMIQDRKRGSQHEITQLVCLPVFHAFAAQLSLVLPLRDSIPTYFMTRFNQQDFVKVVQRFRITDVAVVPPIITTLLDPKTISALPSLRYILCAGAPMDPKIQDRFYELIHHDGVVAQVWGTTETGWITAFGSSERDSSGSVGRLLEGVELMIADEDGRAVADGVRGEAYVRSPSTYSGYLGKPAAAQPEIDEDGYYHTGDRAYLQDGNVFIDGRIKDIMKVNGWQVSPAELEKILHEHPSIADVAVVGKDHINSMGLKETLPRAFVQRRRLSDQPPSFISEDDVKNFLAARVMPYKRLSGGVVFVDSIPRNSTGKTLQRLLAENASDDNDVATVVAGTINKAEDDATPFVAETATRAAACPPELTKKLRKSLSKY